MAADATGSGTGSVCSEQETTLQSASQVVSTASSDPTGAREQMAMINQMYEMEADRAESMSDKNAVLTKHICEVTMVNTLLIEAFEGLLEESKATGEVVSEKLERCNAATDAADMCLRRGVEREISNIQGSYNLLLMRMLELEGEVRSVRAWADGLREVGDHDSLRREELGDVSASGDGSRTHSDGGSTHFITPPQSLHHCCISGGNVTPHCSVTATDADCNVNVGVRCSNRKLREELLAKDKMVYSLQRNVDDLNRVVREQELRVCEMEATTLDVKLENSRLAHRVLYLKQLCREIKREIYESV